MRAVPTILTAPWTENPRERALIEAIAGARAGDVVTIHGDNCPCSKSAKSTTCKCTPLALAFGARA